MEQEWVSALTLLSIEHEELQQIDFTDIQGRSLIQNCARAVSTNLFFTITTLSSQSPKGRTT